MKREKLVAGIAIGTVVALILIPKTRRIIYDGLCHLTDTFKNIASDAKEMIGKGTNELNKVANEEKDLASLVNEPKQAW